MARPDLFSVEVVACPARGTRGLAARLRRLSAGLGRTRSAEAAVAGAVAVVVLPAVLPKLVELLNSWMALRKGRSVRVKVSRGDAVIEVEFAPGERGAEEILEFVDRLEPRLDTRARKLRRRKGPGS